MGDAPRNRVEGRLARPLRLREGLAPADRDLLNPACLTTVVISPCKMTTWLHRPAENRWAVCNACLGHVREPLRRRLSPAPNQSRPTCSPSWEQPAGYVRSVTAWCQPRDPLARPRCPIPATQLVACQRALVAGTSAAAREATTPRRDRTKRRPMAKRQPACCASTGRILGAVMPLL